MFPSFIVTFREVLEVALILGVVLAATNGVVDRRKWIASGFAAGIAGSIIVALFTESISNFADGLGQELFNAMVLFTASLIIGWTAIWMKTHAKEMVSQIKEKGNKIKQGELPKITLAVIIALAVLREGSEIVLFTYGMIASGQPINSIISGSILGSATGALAGLALYIGLIKIPTKYIFQVTTWILLLLAAGMSSIAAKYLVAAGYFESLTGVIYNMSDYLSESSIMGQILHALFGYSERPMLIQAIFYLSTLGIFITIMNLPKLKNALQNTTTASVAAIALTTFGLVLTQSDSAFASKKVYSPYVHQGELELELRSGVKFDADEDVAGAEKHKFAVGYGVTDYWFTEVYGIVEKEGEDGSEYDLSDVEWANKFQLTEPGQYFVDVGFYLALEAGLHSGSSDKVEAQLLLAKDIGQFTNYANIELNRKVGENNDDKTNFEAKWSTRYRLHEMFMPGFEIYSEFGELGDSSSFDEQEHQIGPVIYGKLPHNFAYEVGYLFGVSDATPDGEAKLVLEYEIYF